MESSGSDKKFPLNAKDYKLHEEIGDSSIIPDRDFQLRRYQSERGHSGSLYHTKRDTVDETLEGPDFELKGRFKVTAEPYPKEFTNCTFTPFTGGSSSPSSLNTTSVSILQALQSILQQNAMQREEVLRLIKYVEQTSGTPETSVDEPSKRLPATPRERELETQLIHLHQSIGSITELVKKQKQKSAQLENQLNALTQRND